MSTRYYKLRDDREKTLLLITRRFSYFLNFFSIVTKLVARAAVRRSADLLLQGRDWTFQRDNDPKHTAINAQRATHETQTPLEDWPSQSPDLNPIESLWSILDRSISDRRRNAKAELWECAQQAWRKLDSSVLTKLVESVPRRLNAVIDNKGYPTKR